METMGRLLRPVSTVLLPALALALVIAPVRVVSAALVGTGEVMERRNGFGREAAVELLRRDEVRNGLIARGVDPRDAEARIAALTDAELRTLLRDMDQAPAGGGIITAIFIIMAVWMMVDWTGGPQKLFSGETETGPQAAEAEGEAAR